jgi:hypothetical protein
MIGALAFTGANLGVVISLSLIATGIIWLLVRSLRGKEVERRVIFGFVLIAVSAPILFPITFHEQISPVVKAVFDKIESLPAGSTVAISFDFDPAMAPEVQPMANAFTRHCLAKGHKVVFLSLWATGQSLLTGTLDTVVRREFPEKHERVDWVNLGYKAGGQGVLNVIVSDLRKMYPTDVNAVPLDSVPMLAEVMAFRDLSLILAVGGGFPGPKEWVLYVGDPGNVPVAVGAAAVTAPQLYPYYPRQVIGILGGIKSAAEYESALVDKYPQFKSVDKPGLRMMGPQTLAHMVIMMFIVIGNVVYFRSKRLREQI